MIEIKYIVVIYKPDGQFVTILSNAAYDRALYLANMLNRAFKINGEETIAKHIVQPPTQKYVTTNGQRQKVESAEGQTPAQTREGTGTKHKMGE